RLLAIAGPGGFPVLLPPEPVLHPPDATASVDPSHAMCPHLGPSFREVKGCRASTPPCWSRLRSHGRRMYLDAPARAKLLGSRDIIAYAESSYTVSIPLAFDPTRAPNPAHGRASDPMRTGRP